MSEEEIIKYLEKVAKEKLILPLDNYIQGLLDLYNKEKEKNKKCEYYEMVADELYKNSISKDKIIKLLNKYDKASFIAKVDLQELLEERN